MKGKRIRQKPKHKCLGFHAFEAHWYLRKENTWLSKRRQDIGPGLEGMLVISTKPNICGKSEAASIYRGSARLFYSQSVWLLMITVWECAHKQSYRRRCGVWHPGSSRAACLERLPMPPAAALLSQSSPLRCVWCCRAILIATLKRTSWLPIWFSQQLRQTVFGTSFGWAWHGLNHL